MTKKLLSVLIAAFIISLTNAQDYKFGKISKEELEENFFPMDSAAVARIVYKRGNLKMTYENGWWYELDIEARLKIYHKDGFDFATISIPLYTGGKVDEKISGFKGTTYNISGGKVEETKLKRNDGFEEEVNKYYKLKKYTFPRIKETSVLEYKYTLRSPFIFSLPEWKFQYAIPASHIDYQIRIPEYLGYKEFNKGYFTVKRQEEFRNRKITFSYTYNEPGTPAMDAQRTRKVEEEIREKQIDYSANNVPGLEKESFINNIDNYRSAIRHELNFIKMPNTPVEYYNTSWEEVTKKIYESRKFGEELTKANYYEQDLDKIRSLTTSKEELISLIYSFVKDRMVWNNNYGKYTDVGLKKAYKERTGNVAEINLLLTSMLREAGLKANPVLVSTRSHGIPLFPTLDGFNYVISVVEMNDRLILLDATDKFSTPNVLPERALNWYGRLIRQNGSSSSIELMPSGTSQDLANMNVKLKVDGSLEGRFRRKYTNQLALEYRNRFASSNPENYKEYLQNSYDDIIIDTLITNNMYDTSKAILETIEFSKEGVADIIGDNIYLDPILFLGIKENPFKSETREFPIDYSYPRVSRNMINIEIPKGYKVKYLPQSLSLKMPDNLGVFKFLCSSHDNTINLNITRGINSSIIPASYYPSIKEFYAQIIQKETDKIVLTKA